MAEPTGLEPATSDVTGRRSNQLNYDSAYKAEVRGQRLEISFARLLTSNLWPLASAFGGRGGTRTPNLFLVREAVYH
jgi:hypothetical protein